MLALLISELKTLQGTIGRVKSVNVNSSTIKSAAIELGKKYFSEFHPKVLQINGDVDGAFASNWQRLISLAHGNNSKKSYTSLLTAIQKRSAELNVQSLSAPPSSTNSEVSNFISTELALLQTLDQMLPTAAQSYRQAVADLGSKESRLSYRGAAAEFREVLREVLDHLAPDDAVIKQSWYKQEQGRSGPTMKQKVSFVLKSRNFGDTKRKPTEKSAELIETLFGEITRACYDRTSLSVHLKTTKDEVSRIRQFEILILSELLELG